ncbi:MAG: glycosyltransferase, partial [Candidatus Electrothrix sp. AR3]|nr:glycosyltransferase [Candidatus Electrothrix sp. AR3]
SSQESLACLYEDFKVAPEKTLFLQDVVPESFFKVVSSLQKKELIPANRKVILYTGSLLPGKGVQHILEDMQALSAQRDDLFFLLVGYPIDAAKDYVVSHHLEQCCLLPGRVDYAELAGWLALGDIALDPKEADSGEASGKLLHYMAAGLPVVCFDTINNRKMLGEAGYFAPSCDAQGLIMGINAALDDMELARSRGEEGRNRVRQRYSSAAVGRILDKIYSRFMATS